MQNKKKRIIIGVIILVIILLIIGLIIFNRKVNNEQEKLQRIDLSELLEIENIESCGYEIEKTEEKISTKYITGRNMYEVKANVQAGEIEGKIIYVRGTENLNIYKVENALNKYKDVTRQIQNIMQEFETVCEGYMEITKGEYKETEQLYGESTESFERPVEESIYYEERLYSKTYKSGENEYDVNFYREDNKIICEFVNYV